MRVYKERIVSQISIGLPQGFAVSKSYYSKDYTEIADFVKSQYYYEVDLTDEDSCIDNFKDYLLRYMKPSSEIELWSIELDGDYSKHYTIMPKLNNIPSKDILMVDDEIDYYTENYYEPVRREIKLSMLSKKDVLFILENTGVCLTIRN